MKVRGRAEPVERTSYSDRMSLYFDPGTAMSDEDRRWFRAPWEDRLWLNVPGPLYCGETDTCWTGRLSAPDHVLYGGRYFTEYIYRQPKTPAETALLVEAAACEVFSGYACDGDSRWTPAAVRDWWRDRGRITEYLTRHFYEWDEHPDAKSQGIRAGIRDFQAYIADELAGDLRIYLYWLDERRSPDPGDRLPEL